MRSISRPFLISVAILIIVIVGFVYYYSRASAAILAADTAISNLNSQVISLQGQLSVASSQLASVQSQLSSSNYQLATVQNQLSAANTQVSSLQNEISSFKSQVSSLQNEISSYKSQISSLQSDISSYKSQIDSLQGQLQAVGAANVTALQEQVALLQKQNVDLTDIVKLKKVSVKLDALAVVQQPSHPYWLAKFTADYAGYVLVAGQTNTQDAYITLENSFPGYPYPYDYRYQFGTGATLVIPVLPGTVAVYFNNANPNSVATGTISVKYYY